MTITDKLTYLSSTKNKIKQAIVNKGVAVSDSDTFRSYADKIGRIQGGETKTILSPVSSGLLHWFDAIDNNGYNQHSNSASGWYNKGGYLYTGDTNTGNAYYHAATKLGTVTWGTNYLELTNEKSGFYIYNLLPCFNKQEITMEAVITLTNSTVEDVGVIFGIVQAGGPAIRINMSGNIYFGYYYASSVSATNRVYTTISDTNINFLNYINEKIYICARFNKSGASLYVKCADIECQAHDEYLGALAIANLKTPCAIGYNCSNTGTYDEQQFYGKIHSLRCYCRAISDEEMQNNLAYERQRYNF